MSDISLSSAKDGLNLSSLYLLSQPFKLDHPTIYSPTSHIAILISFVPSCYETISQHRVPVLPFRTMPFKEQCWIGTHIYNAWIFPIQFKHHQPVDPSKKYSQQTHTNWAIKPDEYHRILRIRSEGEEGRGTCSRWGTRRRRRRPAGGRPSCTAPPPSSPPREPARHEEHRISRARNDPAFSGVG
jgi:hypothetical protein